MSGVAIQYATEVALVYDGDDCLIWPYHRDRQGYAHLGGNNASRYVCKLAHGEPPSAIHQAAHSCGKGHEGCVNPKHLSWKTPKENEADKVLHGTHKLRGTGICGEAVKGSRLKEDDIRKIRALKGEMGPTAIGKMFGVNPVHVWKIQTGKKWAHVA